MTTNSEGEQLLFDLDFKRKAVLALLDKLVLGIAAFVVVFYVQKQAENAAVVRDLTLNVVAVHSRIVEAQVEKLIGETQKYLRALEETRDSRTLKNNTNRVLDESASGIRNALRTLAATYVSQKEPTGEGGKTWFDRQTQKFETAVNQGIRDAARQASPERFAILDDRIETIRTLHVVNLRAIRKLAKAAVLEDLGAIQEEAEESDSPSIMGDVYHW